MRARYLPWLVALAPFLAVPWLLPGARPAPRPAAVGGGAALPDASRFKLVGTGSCGGRACHGAIEPLGGQVRQNEFTTWIAHDRHADAFRVLGTERSKRIVAKLKGLADWKKANPQAEAVCLSCHVYPDISTAPHVSHGQDDAAFIRDFDGVGCENCHGPAEQWLHVHALPDWRKKSPEEKARLGMRPLTTALDRAEVCVTCHVGSATADMNHDLIAAGHPRLNFEYSAYLANMPRHWVEKKPDPAAEAQAWAVGQVVTARAALNLLAARAEPPHPWPEFAEYDCFACHHELHADSWRRERGDRHGTPGSLVPETWYLSLPRAMAQTRHLPELAASLDGIAAGLGKPWGDRAKVAQDARKAAELCSGLLREVNKAPANEADFRHWLAELAAEAQRRGLTWDEAGQLYLALAAFEDAYDPEGRDKKVHEAVAGLYKDLSFPRSQDSPGEDASRERFEKALKGLEQVLK
jgi:hypothetical protein